MTAFNHTFFREPILSPGMATILAAAFMSIALPLLQLGGAL